MHIGGNPASLYDSVATTNENAGSQLQTPSNPIGGFEPTIAAGNVFINVDQLNLNGTIQSGVPVHKVTIPNSSAIRTLIYGYDEQYADSTGDQIRTISNSFYTNNSIGNASLVLKYDAANKRLDLSGGINVKGGNIQINARKIINTSGGSLKALDGFGEISIDNQTNFDLVVADLDTGGGLNGDGTVREIEGQIKITETGRDPDGPDSVLRTVFTRDGNTVNVTDNDTSTPDISKTVSIGNANSNTTDAEYYPVADARYNWATSRAEGAFTIWDFTDDDPPGNQDWRDPFLYLDRVRTDDNITFQETDATRRLDVEGGYVLTDAGNDAVYTYALQEDTILTKGFTTLVYYGSFSDPDKVEYTTENSNSTLFTSTHSVKADYPIKITFLGNQGLIDIDSKGSVIVGGQLAARGGTINITSKNGSIESADELGALLGRTINLDAATGIGGETPLYTDLTEFADASVSAVTTAGAIVVEEVFGDLSVAQARTGISTAGTRTGAGDVVLSATTGSILGYDRSSSEIHLVQGDSIELSANQSIGDTDLFLNIDTAVGDNTLTATAGLDVFVSEVDDDLKVNQISGRQVYVDVAEGSLLDAVDDSLSRDEDAVEALLNNWEELGLIGDGAQTRIQEVLDGQVLENNEKYQRYWNQRSALADPSDPSSFTFAFSADQRQSLLDAGFTTGQIDTAVQDVLDRFFELDAIFGVGGTYDTVNDGTDDYDPDTFDSSFSYELTQNETETLTDGIEWQEGELLWGLSTATVDTTSDTTALQETPNLIGDVIVVTVADTFGQNTSGTTTIGVPEGDVLQIVDTPNNDLKIALLSAEPEDIGFFLVDGSGVAQPWVDSNGNQIVDPEEFDRIVLTNREDVDIAGRSAVNPTISIVAEDGIFLGAEVDIDLNEIRSDNGTTRTDVRIKVDGAQVNGALGSATNVIADDLILEAADGNIGASTRPVSIDLSGGLTARSSGSVTISDTSGTLNLVSLFAPGTASLSSSGVILDANDTGGVPVLNVVAAALMFEADSVGTVANPIEIDLGGGPLGGDITDDLFVTVESGGVFLDGLTSSGGLLAVDVGGDIDLGLVRSIGGTIDLTTADGSILDGNGDAVNLQAGAGNINLSAPTGDVGEAIDFIDVTAGATITTESASGIAFVLAKSIASGSFIEKTDAVTDLLASRRANSVELHDFDLDGDLDALAGNLLLLNDGSANFTVLLELSSAVSAGADLDGDGDIDVIQIGPGGRAQLRRNLTADGQAGVFEDAESPFSLIGANEPTFSTNLNNLRTLYLADVLGDGIADLVSTTSGVRFYINNGSGLFTSSTTLTTPFGVKKPLFIDVNGDKTNDLIAFGGGQQAITLSQPTVYLNDGSGNFTFFFEVPTLSSVLRGAMAAGDVDNDGDNDLFWTTTDGAEIFLNRGDGVFDFSSRTTDGETYSGAAQFADLDFDGDLDAVIKGSLIPNGGTTYFNDGTGVFSKTNQTDQLLGGTDIALGDLDGDGAPDIYTVTGTSGSSTSDQVFLNIPGVRVANALVGLFENPQVGDLVGYAVFDAPAPGDFITLEIFDDLDRDDDTPEAFSIDPVTGAITVADSAPFDYESNPSLFFRVRGTNSTGLTGEGSVIVFVGDLRDDPIKIASNFYIFEDSASGTSLGASRTNALEQNGIPQVLDSVNGNDRIVNYEIVGGARGMPPFFVPGVMRVPVK